MSFPDQVLRCDQAVTPDPHVSTVRRLSDQVQGQVLAETIRMRVSAASRLYSIPNKWWHQQPQELFVAVTNRIPLCGQNTKLCLGLNISLVGRHCAVGFSLLTDIVDDALHGDHGRIWLLANMSGPNPDQRGQGLIHA